MRKKPHLHKFQKEDALRVERVFRNRALYGWDMGLGKTVASLTNVIRADAFPLIVVCPATAKEGWVRQCKEHYGIRAVALESRRPPRKMPAAKVYVINYDVLWFWRVKLRGLRPKAIIWDEAQKARNHRARWTKALTHLVKGVPVRLALTGTPVVNRPMDLYATICLLKPWLFPSKWRFGFRFCAGKKHPYGGWDFSGSSRAKELNRILLDNVMVRRRKEDVLHDLPAKTRTVVPFLLTKAARDEYAEAEDDFRNWLKRKHPGKSRFSLASEKLSKLGYLRRLAAELKLPQTIRWVADFLEDTDEKLLLFGIHRTFLKEIFRTFRTHAVLVTGGTPHAERQWAFDRFNGSKKCRLGIMNVEAGGVAWSCTSASNVAFAEVDWVPANHEQAEERVRGIGRGTGRPVTAHYLLAEGTIEEVVFKVLQRKSKVAKAVVDGRTSGALDVFALYQKSLLGH